MDLRVFEQPLHLRPKNRVKHEPEPTHRTKVENTKTYSDDVDLPKWMN
jgi:hypothetical protein